VGHRRSRTCAASAERTTTSLRGSRSVTHGWTATPAGAADPRSELRALHRRERSRASERRLTRGAFPALAFPRRAVPAVPPHPLHLVARFSLLRAATPRHRSGRAYFAVPLARPEKWPMMRSAPRRERGIGQAGAAASARCARSVRFGPTPVPPKTAASLSAFRGGERHLRYAEAGGVGASRSMRTSFGSTPVAPSTASRRSRASRDEPRTFFPRISSFFTECSQPVSSVTVTL
jgi:hypothetical protein